MSMSQGRPAEDASLDVKCRATWGRLEDAKTFFRNVFRTSSGRSFAEWEATWDLGWFSSLSNQRPEPKKMCCLQKKCIHEYYMILHEYCKDSTWMDYREKTFLDMNVGEPFKTVKTFIQHSVQFRPTWLENVVCKCWTWLTTFSR